MLSDFRIKEKRFKHPNLISNLMMIRKIMVVSIKNRINFGIKRMIMQTNKLSKIKIKRLIHINLLISNLIHRDLSHSFNLPKQPLLSCSNLN
jgi:hypothetical protein